MPTPTDWPWPLKMEDVPRERLEEKVRELQQLLEDLPTDIRSRGNFAVGHLARVWFGTGLEVAAKVAEETWYRA